MQTQILKYYMERKLFNHKVTILTDIDEAVLTEPEEKRIMEVQLLI